MNQIVPVPQGGTPTTQDGWWWDGQRWRCDPCMDPCPPCPPCPPFFPPPATQPPWFPGANGGVSFSPTPPPNPVRGHFWWDGTALHMFDGAAWVVVGGDTSSKMGVTDGSDAPPGTIGEYYVKQTPVTFPVAATTQFINGGVLLAGDWNCSCSFIPEAWVAGVTFMLSPVPNGIFVNMLGFEGNLGTITGIPVSESDGIVYGIPTRASLSVPTPFIFSIQTNYLGVGNPGTGNFIFQARRAR